MGFFTYKYWKSPGRNERDTLMSERSEHNDEVCAFALIPPYSVKP